MHVYLYVCLFLVHHLICIHSHSLHMCLFLSSALWVNISQLFNLIDCGTLCCTSFSRRTTHHTQTHANMHTQIHTETDKQECNAQSHTHTHLAPAHACTARVKWRLLTQAHYITCLSLLLQEPLPMGQAWQALGLSCKEKQWTHNTHDTHQVQSSDTSAPHSVTWEAVERLLC